VFKNSGLNHIGSVMVSMVAWGMVDHGFTVESNQSHGRVKPESRSSQTRVTVESNQSHGRVKPESRSSQTKDYTIGICCFFAKCAALRSKNKNWLAWNQDNVSEWSDMLFQGTSTININISVLV
jgi:hypothetical protein